MQSAAFVALVLAATTKGAVGVISDVFSETPFELDSGEESYVAGARYTDSIGVSCYLGAEIPQHGRRGQCTLVERGEVVGETLVEISDKTLHNAMASLTEATTIWCYADAENSFGMRCSKLNREGQVLSRESSGEIGIKGNSGDVYGTSVISVARFSDVTAVVCYDNPTVQEENPATKGPMQCALLFIKPEDDQYCASCLGVNSDLGIVSLDTGSVLTASVVSFDATSGAVCYTKTGAGGTEVACTELTLSGSSESDYTITEGDTITVSASGADSAAVVLSERTGLVCYTESEATQCRRLEFSGSALSNGDDALELAGGAVSHLTLKAFTNETVVACYQNAAGGGASCFALDTAGAELESGYALDVDDAAADKALSVVSLTDSSGLLCYESTSGSGTCRELQVAPRTTTSETSSSTQSSTTQSSTTTFATTTLSATTGSSGTHSSSSTTTSSSEHTKTETFTTTSPHTTTRTSTLAPVALNEDSDSSARIAGGKAAWAFAALAVWAL